MLSHVAALSWATSVSGEYCGERRKFGGLLQCHAACANGDLIAETVFESQGGKQTLVAPYVMVSRAILIFPWLQVDLLKLG
ncbi:MAG: hypothetical protein CMJ20_01385 [Phycisphaeraceae bacterium]|nr:hypothetical protein [Phycisphaeraceae bacterium]